MPRKPPSIRGAGGTASRTTRDHRHENATRRTTDPERLRFFGSTAWKSLRKLTRERDGYCCRACGSHRARLHGHHIKPWDTHPHLRLDENNIVTLGTCCHAKVEAGVIPCPQPRAWEQEGEP